MTEQEHDDTGIEAFFDAARSHAPVPSEALMARILTDAGPFGKCTTSPVAEGLWQKISAALCGWQGIGGLATAAAAGLWIGFAGLADPATLSGGVIDLGAEQVELMPDGEVFALAAGMED